MARKKKRQKPDAAFQPETDNGRYWPVTARVAVGDVNDKYSEYPSDGLTPRRLARIFKQADEGDVRAQMELYEEMEAKDPHLYSQMQTRKLAVTSLDWEVQPASDDEFDKAVADFVREQLEGMEDLNDTLTDLLDAIGKGISILELSWAIDEDGRNVIDGIEYVHQKKLTWDSVTDEMLVCTKEYPAGISLPENKFVVHRYKARSGHESKAGVLRVIAWMYLFKNYDVKDWVSFCEIFGMPLRLGKYDASASEADKRQLMEAILSLGTDAAGIVPTTTMIDFIESQKTTSVEIYEKLARYCDEQISKAVLGQTLTSDSGGGSYAQSKTHNEVRHDLMEADAVALAATIRRDIIRPLVEYNFGLDADIPSFSFATEEKEDQKELVEVYRTLVCDMGLEIPKAHVYKKFSIPKPEDGEEVLSRPAASAQAPLQAEPDMEALKLDDSLDAQAQVDMMSAMSQRQAQGIFREMVKPILRLVDGAKDMEDLQKVLKDEAALERLYREMDSPELEELLRQGIYLSGWIGRSME